MSTLAPLPFTALTDPTALVVEDMYKKMAEGWPFLNQVTEDTFHRRRVPTPQRADLARLLTAMVRLRRAVEFALGPDVLPRPRLLASAVLAGLAPPDAMELLEPAHRDALASWEARAADIEDPVERLGVRHSLPDWIAALMLGQLGNDRAVTLAQAFNRPPPLTVRANRLQVTVEELAEKLAAEGIESRRASHAPDGLILLGHAPVFQTKAFKDGLLEMQDQASQLVCQMVAPPPGSMVVDACAGAGGKTLGLAALLGNKGQVMALDTHAGRLRSLKLRARRAGVHNVQSHQLTADGPSPVRPPGAARVLVDAPCTGLGALRRNPEARWRLQAPDITRLSGAQLEILQRAAPWVMAGGRLIYAVCSFARAEAEDVRDAFLAANTGWTPVAPREITGKAVVEGLETQDGTALRTWPDLHDMDGFFAVVLRRRA